MKKLSWLERGVKERGGGAPSQKTLPLSRIRVFIWQNKVLREKGIKGVSINIIKNRVKP
jgi:hypothetical protein